MLLAEHIDRQNGLLSAAHQTDLDYACVRLDRDEVSAAAVLEELARFSVAAPSWALGTGGTRFGRFPIGGEPRDIYEKLDDIATLNALTGANRTVSLHIPWDDVDDPAAVRAHAKAVGLGFDAMNSNTFQDNPATTAGGSISYKFGSLAHADRAVRDVAVAHNKDVIELGVELGSRALTVWLADGTNHPGQASFATQFERTIAALSEIHDSMPPDWLIFTEHKPYEPAFYSTVNPDWGSSLLLAQGAGERGRCIVDLGHHLPNANIEQIVSRVAQAGRLGGFHFNDSKYGDDDLTAGSVKPFQLFLIMLELLEVGGGAMPELAYMIDASHNLKDPIEDLIQATDALHVAIAQALCVSRPKLLEAQSANDPVLAAEVLTKAFRTDVRPLVAEARRTNGAALDPLGSFRGIKYRAAKLSERGSHSAASGL